MSNNRSLAGAGFVAKSMGESNGRVLATDEEMAALPNAPLPDGQGPPSPAYKGPPMASRTAWFKDILQSIAENNRPMWRADLYKKMKLEKEYAESLKLLQATEGTGAGVMPDLEQVKKALQEAPAILATIDAKESEKREQARLEAEKKKKENPPPIDPAKFYRTKTARDMSSKCTQYRQCDRHRKASTKIHSEVKICESAHRIMIVNWDATDPENKKGSWDFKILNQAATPCEDCNRPQSAFLALRDRMISQHGQFTDGGKARTACKARVTAAAKELERLQNDNATRSEPYLREQLIIRVEEELALAQNAFAKAKTYGKADPEKMNIELANRFDAWHEHVGLVQKPVVMAEKIKLPYFEKEMTEEEAREKAKQALADRNDPEAKKLRKAKEKEKAKEEKEKEKAGEKEEKVKERARVKEAKVQAKLREKEEATKAKTKPKEIKEEVDEEEADSFEKDILAELGEQNKEGDQDLPATESGVAVDSPNTALETVEVCEDTTGTTTSKVNTTAPSTPEATSPQAKDSEYIHDNEFSPTLPKLVEPASKKRKATAAIDANGVTVSVKKKIKIVKKNVPKTTLAEESPVVAPKKHKSTAEDDAVPKTPTVHSKKRKISAKDEAEGQAPAKRAKKSVMKTVAAQSAADGEQAVTSTVSETVVECTKADSTKMVKKTTKTAVVAEKSTEVPAKDGVSSPAPVKKRKAVSTDDADALSTPPLRKKQKIASTTAVAEKSPDKAAGNKAINSAPVKKSKVVSTDDTDVLSSLLLVKKKSKIVAKAEPVDPTSPTSPKPKKKTIVKVESASPAASTSPKPKKKTVTKKITDAATAPKKTAVVKKTTKVYKSEENVVDDSD